MEPGIIKRSMLTKLEQVEWITLNVASIGWVIVDVMEALPTAVTVFVGISIAFLNIARGIKALRESKDKHPKNKFDKKD